MLLLLPAYRLCKFDKENEQELNICRKWITGKEGKEQRKDGEEEASDDIIISPSRRMYRVGQKTGLFLEVCNSRVC